jgi:hypothetical protein
MFKNMVSVVRRRRFEARTGWELSQPLSWESVASSDGLWKSRRAGGA